MKCLLLFLILLPFTCAAADLAGTWKGTASTPGGTSERTFIFKVNGNTLTGETSSPLFGKSSIMDGKIDGDKVTFSIIIRYQDNEATLNYTGKVDGNEIKFHVASADGSISLDYTATKVS